MNGYGGGNYNVNDPGFSRNSYPESDVVGIRVYNPVGMTLLEEIFAGRIWDIKNFFVI